MGWGQWTQYTCKCASGVFIGHLALLSKELLRASLIAAMAAQLLNNIYFMRILVTVCAVGSYSECIGSSRPRQSQGTFGPLLTADSW